MMKRIEFSLNLDDPEEAQIYYALRPSLRYRRGGAIIRQALGAFFAGDEHPLPQIIKQEKKQDEQTKH